MAAADRLIPAGVDIAVSAPLPRPRAPAPAVPIAPWFFNAEFRRVRGRRGSRRRRSSQLSNKPRSGPQPRCRNHPVAPRPQNLLISAHLYRCCRPEVGASGGSVRSHATCLASVRGPPSTTRRRHRQLVQVEAGWQDAPIGPASDSAIPEPAAAIRGSAIRRVGKRGSTNQRRRSREPGRSAAGQQGVDGLDQAAGGLDALQRQLFLDDIAGVDLGVL